MNTAGQVTGYSLTAGKRSEAFITGPNGAALRGLGFLGGATESIGNGINASGQVTGSSFNSTGYSEAFLTGPDGFGMTGIGFLNTANRQSAGYGVNAVGQITGSSRNGYGTYGFITGPNGTGMESISDLGAAVFPGTTGMSINNSGQITGTSRNRIEEPEAFVTGANGAGVTAMGYLATLNAAYTHASGGNGINSSGQVAGHSINSAGRSEPFVTGPNGHGMTGLGFADLAGGKGYAWGINDAGSVVGSVWGSRPGGLRDYGFLWTPAGGMQLLDDLVTGLGTGWQIEDARAISDNGFIAATAYNPQTRTYEAVLLTPTVTATPEPASWVLFGTGLVLLAAISRRRTSARA